MVLEGAKKYYGSDTMSEIRKVGDENKPSLLFDGLALYLLYRSQDIQRKNTNIAILYKYSYPIFGRIVNSIAILYKYSHPKYSGYQSNTHMGTTRNLIFCDEILATKKNFVANSHL